MAGHQISDGAGNLLPQLERLRLVQQCHRQAEAIGHAVLQAGKAAEVCRLAAHQGDVEGLRIAKPEHVHGPCSPAGRAPCGLVARLYPRGCVHCERPIQAHAIASRRNWAVNAMAVSNTTATGATSRRMPAPRGKMAARMVAIPVRSKPKLRVIASRRGTAPSRRAVV